MLAKKAKPTTPLLLGLQNGIIQAGNWLDANHGMQTTFDEFWPMALTTLIKREADIPETSVQLDPGGHDKIYVERLTEHARAFVLGHNTAQNGYYHRTTELIHFFSLVKELDLTPALIGQEVVGQMAGTFFGRMSAQGKAATVLSGVREFLKADVERESPAI